MATYNWKNIPATKPKFCGIEVPDGVKGIFSHKISYKDYDLRFSEKSNEWNLIDYRGTVIDRFTNTKEGKREGFLKLLGQPAADQKAYRQVIREEAAFKRSLEQESLPRGMGPWAAAVLYQLKPEPIS